MTSEKRETYLRNFSQDLCNATTICKQASNSNSKCAKCIFLKLFLVKRFGFYQKTMS